MDNLSFDKTVYTVDDCKPKYKQRDVCDDCMEDGDSLIYILLLNKHTRRNMTQVGT